ncbi:MAG TPA: hypothetical protein VHC39_16130 [Rhizomicrobium sp.]|nr:hypothetical protein [Rhizomicrobium sp.]
MRGAAALPFAASAARAADSVAVRKAAVNIDASRTLATIAPDYMGLGFEISSVAVPGLLAASNRAYVKLVQGLGRDGVIRIGGNTSDFARYDAHGKAVSAPKATVVTEANLRELKSFLDAIGWKLIWGLNLGDDRLDNAVAEARAVGAIMGDRLLALEIGNEPDLFPRSGHRGADYGYPAWFADYRRYKRAIRAVLPHAPFAGPDLAGAADWMEQFARDDHDIALLTAHHYITGQANPLATIDTMLANNVKYDSILARFQQAAQQAGKPWRMCETASFSGGGRQGVSDTFAAALWALDYLFVLAEHGCAGVNMETGVNHLGWISHYTPIGDDLKGHYTKAPEYYGLAAFARVPKGDVLAVDCRASDVNLTAHAVKKGQEICVALINKDLKHDAAVTIGTGGMTRIRRALQLTAPTADAKTGITLGNSAIAPTDIAGHVGVGAASAVLVWLEA